jgi:hypothetical protein
MVSVAAENRCRRFPSPAASDPPMNEDGHVSITRRGFYAAGLAVAVVGSMGTVWTLNAGAEEVPGAPVAVAAEVPADAASGLETPPAKLPWGAKPERLTRGRAGASSKALAAAGADIAQNSTRDTRPTADFAPKGFTSDRTSRTTSLTSVVPPAPGGVGALAEPVPGQTKVSYFYSSAYQFAQTDGSYANLVISKPKLADDDYHTLAEIAVQSADGRQIVEVGWSVDRAVNGDDDPHLFVYHWVDRQESCYNGCGFVNYSKTAWPGMTLPEGVSKRFGIQYFNGAWWIAYDSEWIGYYPVDLWDGTFTRSGLIQWFGEVAASSSEPCTWMGNGLKGEDPSAARVGSVSLLAGPDPVIELKAKSPYYTAYRASDRTMRYGGSGAKTEKCAEQ